jgi:hypothetical protein
LRLGFRHAGKSYVALHAFREAVDVGVKGKVQSLAIVLCPCLFNPNPMKAIGLR